MDQEEFIEKVRDRHGNEYGYYRAIYVDDITPVIIYCDRHGNFEMTPDDHILKGHRCPKCAADQMESIRRRQKFVALRQRYYEVYQTFNQDLAHEVIQCPTIEKLAEVIHAWHEHGSYALVELFMVMVNALDYEV